MTDSINIGFIAKVNEVYSKLPSIILSTDLFNQEAIDLISKLELQELYLIAEDLKKVIMQVVESLILI